jgi:hypothetical protein
MSFFSSLFGPPSPEKFANQFAKELRRQGETGKVAINLEKFQITLERDRVISLGNLHAEHCTLPRSARRAHLQRLVGVFTDKKESPDDFAEARPNIRPKIFPRATIETLKLQARLSGKPAIDLPVYPLGEHLYSSLVYDLPTAMRSINGDELEKWGVTYYEAMEAALENLDKSTIAWAKIGDVFCSAVSGDNYDSARILLIERIRSEPFKGDPVAMVPQRDALYVTGTEEEAGLGIMLKMAQDVFTNQPRPLSPVPLRLVDGEWEDWSLPKSHPHFAAFEHLRQTFFAQLYHEQKQLLEAIHEKEHIDVFVASFSGFQNQDTGEVRSYCTWIEDLPSLLPETQFIAIVSKEGKPVASGRVEDVRKIVGDLLSESPDYYPLRYSVNGFPTAEQLQRIGDHLKVFT